MTTTYATTPCKSCKRPVIWARTDTGKLMPVDAEPSPDGSVALSKQDGQVRSRVVGVKFRFGRKDLYLSHFASCPNAARHRRGGGRRA